jgi:hypothetical protein
LGGVPPSTDAEVTDNGTAQAVTDDVGVTKAALTDLDGTNATASVHVAGLAESNTSLASALGMLNSLDGTNATASFTTTHTTNYVQTGAPTGAGMHGMTAMAHGGTAFDPLMPRFANGGTYALVGEVGPELVKLSRGDQVMPTGGSRAMLERGRGRGGTITVQTLNLYPASPDVDAQIRAAVLGEWR